MPTTHVSPVIHTKKSSTSFISVFLTVLSVFLIVFGALGLIYLQTPLREASLDTRRDASVDNGQVLVSFNAQPSTFKKDQQATVDVLVNTQNNQTKGVELVFSVITDTIDDLNIEASSDTTLSNFQQEVESTDDGFLISFKADPTSGQSFTTSSPKKVLRLVFTPKRTGSFKLDFDAEKSVAYKTNTTDEDLLRTVSSVTYSVENTVATTVKSCNESCTSNAECPTNHRCFENRCRVVTNLTSTTCAAPADKGLQRQCNEYCADTRECGAGFTCYFNRCRRPDNVESTSCTVPSAAVQTAIAQSCNKSCSSNRDCANNMRCYGSVCRLATNPSSTSCSAMTSRPVSGIYYTVPSGTGPTKGQGGTADQPSASPRVSPRPGAATGSGTATRSGQATGAAGLVSPRPLASPTVKPSPVVTPLPSAQPGVFTRLTDSIKQGGLSLPLVALIAGLGLLLIVIVMGLLNLFRRRSSSVPPATVVKNQQYEQSLQDKINALKTQAAAPVTTAPRTQNPGASTVPPTPVVTKSEVKEVKTSEVVTAPPSTLRPQPTGYTPSPVVAPTQAPALPARPVVQTAQATRITTSEAATPLPPVTASTPTEPNRASSMLERIKNKGIVPPGDQG